MISSCLPTAIATDWAIAKTNEMTSARRSRVKGNRIASKWFDGNRSTSSGATQGIRRSFDEREPGHEYDDQRGGHAALCRKPLPPFLQQVEQRPCPVQDRYAIRLSSSSSTQGPYEPGISSLDLESHAVEKLRAEKSRGQRTIAGGEETVAELFDQGPAIPRP